MIENYPALVDHGKRYQSKLENINAKIDEMFDNINRSIIQL